MSEPVDLVALERVLHGAIELAKEYREVTGKPLGITGEVGEFHAARLLGWELADARQPGYDAVAPDGHRVQIKTRCILPGASPSQRVGGIRLTHAWDTVALVLVDGDFAPQAIYEASRPDIERALALPGSKARNERGALAVGRFRAIATLVWPVSGTPTAVVGPDPTATAARSNIPQITDRPGATHADRRV